MLPAINEPTTIILPDGRQAVITVTLLGDGWPSKIPLPTVPPTGPPPKTPSSPAAKTPPKKAPVMKAGKLVVKSKPIPAAPQELTSPAIDHPLIGGKLTAFILFYGVEYFEMHRRCITALLDTAGNKLEVRAYANCVGNQSLEMLERLVADGKITHLYRSTENPKKGPALREMFHDPDRPIKTPWMLYLDDDTFVDKDSNWLSKVCETIVTGSTADPRLGAVGIKQVYNVSSRQATWIKSADWYRGRPFCDRTGKEVPNGTAIHFVTGSFWAARADCLKLAGVPDRRLVHNGFDVAMGEQVRQAGFTMKALPGGGGKDLIAWSAVPRRGYREGIFGIK